VGPHAPLDPVVAQNLGLALVASSNAPILLLDDKLTIIAASKSFCCAFGIDPNKVAGGRLTNLGDGAWNVPQLASLLNATASGFAEIENYEMTLKREGQKDRCLVLNAQKLDYTAGADIRLVLSVTDITDARLAEKLKADMLLEKEGMLREKERSLAERPQSAI
jgi:nitrogen-specific signal transduction histidine kinase